MNLFWKELFFVLAGMVLVALILYDLFHKAHDRLSVFLMVVFLCIIGTYLVANAIRMLYNFGFWFVCW